MVSADTTLTPEFVDTAFTDGPIPEVRYSSGLSTYHERLIRGRFVAHHHSTTGRVKSTEAVDALLDAMVGRRPVEAFALDVDGYSLTSQWRWAGTAEQAAADGKPTARHCIVRLIHRVRPIEVCVHTLLDGTSFLVRWLEITNRGSQPAALTSVAPWSGLLWHVPTYQSRLPAGQVHAFSLGHYAQTGQGHEGDFVWEGLRGGTTVYVRYYFGHISGYHEYGDLDFQLRVVLFANPIFVGFAPNADGMDPPVRERILHYVELYKTFMRPILPACRVYHHTPALALASAPPWCVLEYAGPDANRAYAGIFRLSSSESPLYHFCPRGLDPQRTYRVTLDNSGRTFDEGGAALLHDGLRVGLESPLTSELILFESL